MNKYKDNVGNRVLIDWGISGLLEVRILEVSPSGDRAKIKSDGHTEWIKVWQHDIVEVLPENRPWFDRSTPPAPGATGQEV